MTQPSPTRRAFLSSLGALSVAGALPVRAWAATGGANIGRTATEIRRGLAAADDFGFAPGLVYLQTGSLGPTPRPVIERTMEAWKELERNPTLVCYGKHEQEMEEVRAKAAAFIGCGTDELLLTNSTSEGMNWVAQGITFARGDRILTTDQEHPGGRACWDYVARRYGVIIDVVPIPPGENNPSAIVARFRQQMTPRTRVLSFSHLLTSTGLRMPVAELSALARSRKCLSVVDGAQAIGAVALDMTALGCDVYATSGHKWLLGPKGTGLLYIRADVGARIDPIALQSGHSAYNASTGVCSTPSALGLGAAIDYISSIGLTSIEAHNNTLYRRLYDGMKRVSKASVVSAAPGSLSTAQLTFSLPPDAPSGELAARLFDKHQIQVKVVPANMLNGNRISMHLFNTERDVDALIAALKVELA